MYSEVFIVNVLPAEVVIAALCGQSSQAELCRKHNLSDVQPQSGNAPLLENAVTLFEPTPF